MDEEDFARNLQRSYTTDQSNAWHNDTSRRRQSNYRQLQRSWAIVISGDLHALKVATTLAKARGATRVIPLSVSGAFHSPIMASATDKLAHFIANTDIHDATIPIISNITATPLTQSTALCNELAQQLAAPVQWVLTIEYLTSVGITTFFEIGPGRALASMIKRIARVQRSSISAVQRSRKSGGIRPRDRTVPVRKWFI